MIFRRRQFLRFAGLATVAGISRNAAAQAYPSRPVRWKSSRRTLRSSKAKSSTCSRRSRREAPGLPVLQIQRRRMARRRAGTLAGEASQNIRATNHLQDKATAAWVGNLVMNEVRLNVLKIPENDEIREKKEKESKSNYKKFLIPFMIFAGGWSIFTTILYKKQWFPAAWQQFISKQIQKMKSK